MKARVQYTIDFTFKAKDELLFTYLVEPFNLKVWFADKVEVSKDIYTFNWKGSSEKAKLVKEIMKKKVVYKWIERENEEFLSFEIDIDPVTGSTLLIISDFDDEGQEEAAGLLWENTISKLKRAIGG